MLLNSSSRSPIEVSVPAPGSGAIFNELQNIINAAILSTWAEQVWTIDVSDSHKNSIFAGDLWFQSRYKQQLDGFSSKIKGSKNPWGSDINQPEVKDSLGCA